MRYPFITFLALALVGSAILPASSEAASAAMRQPAAADTLQLVEFSAAVIDAAGLRESRLFEVTIQGAELVALLDNCRQMRWSMLSFTEVPASYICAELDISTAPPITSGTLIGEETSALYIITGKVVDAVGGDPVANARVTVQGWNSAVMTDEAGNYRLKLDSRGWVRAPTSVEAMHRDRLPARRRLVLDCNSWPLRGGSSSCHAVVDFRLDSTDRLQQATAARCTVSGRLVDSSQDDLPVRGTIELVGTGLKTYSAPDGHFSVVQVPPGLYRIWVRAPGYLSEYRLLPLACRSPDSNDAPGEIQLRRSHDIGSARLRFGVRTWLTPHSDPAKRFWRQIDANLPALVDLCRAIPRNSPPRTGAAEALFCKLLEGALATAAEDLPNPPKNVNSISGTVVDATTKRPLPGAVVTLPEIDAVVLTDSLGRYTIEFAGLPSPSSEIIQADLSGYLPEENLADIFCGMIMAPVGQTSYCRTMGIDFHLRPATSLFQSTAPTCAIEGRVRSPRHGDEVGERAVIDPESEKVDVDFPYWPGVLTWFPVNLTTL